MQAIVSAMRSLILSTLVTILLTLPARAEDILVFAAASLAGPLDRVAAAWEQETGHSVTLAFAGSSALARQVQAGAPADVVFLANADWMDVLEDSGVLQADSRRDILGNAMALVINTDAYEALNLNAASDPYEGRFAMALTDSVPAGIYGRAVLEAMGLWEEVQDQVVEADNVRAATLLVATGAVERGIVYQTEALADPRVSILTLAPDRWQPPIRYPAALTLNAAPQAAEFVEFLQGAGAQEIFGQAGFRAAPQ